MLSSPVITVMVSAARKAARGLRRDFGELENMQVFTKAPADFVRRAQGRTAQSLAQSLGTARPDFGFLTEGADTPPGGGCEHRWIVSPIDGMINFIHGIPHFAISLALQRGTDIIAGVIYNPASDLLYSAERGRGAYLNNRRLRVSGRNRLDTALLGCGIPCSGHGDDEQFRRELAHVQGQVGSLRHLGAPSLNLAYVAAGLLDACWERGLNPWNMAAGRLLVTEAGGAVAALGNGRDPLATGGIIAGNAMLAPKLQKLLATGTP